MNSVLDMSWKYLPDIYFKMSNMQLEIQDWRSVSTKIQFMGANEIIKLKKHKKKEGPGQTIDEQILTW